MRWLVALLALSVLLFASFPEFTAEETAYLKEKKAVTMCVDPNWMPYEKIEEGQHVGMSRDYIDLFSEYLGIPITLVPTQTWSESIAYAKARKCDIFSLAMETPERKEYMNFTKPYLSIPLVIATRLDELFIVDIADVLERKLGVVKGYAFAELLRLKYPEINLVEVESIDEGLDRVVRGELYGFVGTLSSVGYAIQRSYIGELKVAGKFDEKWELGVGVRNDDPMLLEVFDKAIDALDYTKQQEIMNKWVSVKYESGIDYELLWNIFWVVALMGLFFSYRHYMLIRYNKMLKKLAVTDVLTGLSNRIRTDESIQTQLELLKRYGSPFSVLLIDIDQFKQVNDKFGHQIGDNVLILLADILRSDLRRTDIAGRWGGEEFIVISPETNLRGALEMAEKIRHSVQERKYNRKHKVTVSIGVTEAHKSDTLKSIIKRADEALYQAKENGRNRVEHFTAEGR